MKVSQDSPLLSPFVYALVVIDPTIRTLFISIEMGTIMSGPLHRAVVNELRHVNIMPTRTEFRFEHLI